MRATASPASRPPRGILIAPSIRTACRGSLTTRSTRAPLDSRPRMSGWIGRTSPGLSGDPRCDSPLAHWRPETNTLVVVEEAWFRVVASAEADNPRLGPDRPLSGLFRLGPPACNAINYETYRSRTLPFVETGRLLIIADRRFCRRGRAVGRVGDPGRLPDHGRSHLGDRNHHHVDQDLHPIGLRRPRGSDLDHPRRRLSRFRP